MLTTDELIASAKGCGFSPSLVDGKVFIAEDHMTAFWLPDADPTQNWLCVKELLRRGYCVEYHCEQCSANHVAHNDAESETFEANCPPEEFAAKALAAIEREK